MSVRLTAGQAHARRVLWALATTALDVIDLRDANGCDEDDDRPRRWLLTLQRWTRGVAAGAEMATATKAMDAWRSDVHRSRPEHGVWTWAVWTIRGAREDLARHPSHVEQHVTRCLGALAAALPESPGSATRVERIYEGHLRSAERVAHEVALATRLSRARVDKARAELVLGTKEEQ